MKVTRKWIARALAVGALGVAASVLVSPSSPEQTTAYAVDGLGAGGEYHPLDPKRIFDSRIGINDVAPLGPKPSNAQGVSFNVDILGKGGIPAASGDVLAAVANVTVVNSGLAGFLSITPTGSAAGESSLVNFNAGEAVPNLAVIGVGTNGRASIKLTTPAGPGSAHVLIDVFGWISTSSYADAADSGARFVPAGPTRFLDTRSGPIPFGWTAGQAVGPKEQLTLQVRGRSGIPNSSAVTGVMVNVTAANNLPFSQATYLSVTPQTTPAGSAPATSVTNVSGGQIKANMAIVPVGPDGAVRIYNDAGATHVIVDVLGYLQTGKAESTRSGRVIPLDSAFRVFDTRQKAFGAAPLGFATKEDWSFKAFAESVTLNGTPIGKQSALIGNLTGTGLEPLFPGQPVTTFMTLYPGSGNPPNASNINVTPGRSVPNMSLLRYGSAGGDPYTISAYNFDGRIHYLLDVYAVVLAD